MSDPTKVTVWATKLPDSDYTVLDCSDCGALGLHEEAGPVVYTHLKDTHGCNMNTVEFDYPEEF